MIMYSRWCSLSLATRNQIAQFFNIAKKGATEVVSNEIKSDGYLIEDIENTLTLDAIQKFLNSSEPNETLEQAWTRLINAVEGNEIEIPVINSPTPDLEVLPQKEAIKAKKEYKARTKVIKTKTTKTNVKAKTKTKK